MFTRKNDYVFHEQLRNCAIGVYGEAAVPEGYSVVSKKTNPKTGFTASVLKKDNEIIVSFQGTNAKIPRTLKELKDFKNSDGKRDLEDDYAMAKRELPKQFEDAKALLKEVESNPDLRNCNITVTGHSLGGSLAQMMGALYGYNTVTFNAYGTKDILDNYNLKYNDKNIVNYSNPKDMITRGNSKNHIGEVYEMESIDGENGLIKNHILESQKTITQQKDFSSDKLMSWHDNVDPYWNKGMDIKHKMMDTVLTADETVKEKVNDIKDTVVESAQNAGREVGSSVYDHMTNEAQMYQNLASNLGELGREVGTNMKNALGNLGSGIVFAPNQLKNSVSNLDFNVENVSNNLKTGVNNIVSAATNVPNDMKNAFGNIASTVKTTPANMKNAFGNFTSAVSAAPNSIKSSLDSVGESFKNAINTVGDLTYKNQATNTSPNMQAVKPLQNSTAVGASNLANPLQPKQSFNNKNGVSTTNIFLSPVNNSLSSGQGVNNSGFSNNLMQNSSFSTPNTENPIKKYNLENKTVDGFRLDNGGEVFVKEFNPAGGSAIGGTWQPWSGDFDPSKKLTDMEEPELSNAIDFFFKYKRSRR